MQRDLYDDIVSIDQLRRGWRRVLANDGAPGGDRVTVDAFAVEVESKLDALHQSLVRGDYWPSPVRVAEIPKKRGGLRTLRIPSVRDRVAQTAASMVLTPLLDSEFEDASFGYRPGRSVRQAVRRVAALRRAGYVWTVDGDIKTFFDEVPHKPLLDRLERAIGCARTVDLVERWLDAYCDSERGLPQGMPLSPVLANLHLDAIDEKIERGGVRLVRFADDFLLLCRSEAVAREALARMVALLREAGLRINPEKTAIRRFEEATRFLGRLFVRGLVLEDVDDGIATSNDAPAAQPDDAEDDSTEPPGDESSDHAPRLRWLYVHEPGRVVAPRGHGFSVREGEDGPEVAAIQPGWADGIEIGPAARIDDEALRLAMAARTAVVFTSSDGGMLAAVEPAPAERAALHLDQARIVLDSERRTDFARRIVAGRLRNQRVLLKRLNRKKKIEAVDRAAHEIGRLAKLARIQQTTDEAMGVEGRGARLYWPALGLLVNAPLTFENRERRPPPDPVNLALSFLSTRLAADMAALIARRGLHPGFACLHASQDGRASLALDLMEEFRAPLAEGLAVFLFNARRLKPEEFSCDENGHLRAAQTAIRTMIRAYEAWLARPVTNPQDDRRTNWRGLMEAQVLAYMRHVRRLGEYEAYRMDY